MKNKVKLIMIAIMAAAFALPAMAQKSTNEQQWGSASAPSASFQSTSTMQSSGSAYSTTPMLNADGTATYNAASTTPAQAPSGPRKVGPPTPEGDPTPVGDGLWALMLMAFGYAGYIIYRRRKVLAK